MLHITKKYFIIIACSLFILFIFFLNRMLPDEGEVHSYVFDEWVQEENEVIGSVEQVTEPDASEAKLVYIDVKGAVNRPNVYKMEEGSRVIDVIERAGGFAQGADQNQVNLAELLYDEQVVYVPKKGEISSISVFSNENTLDTKININTASVKELEQLPGIGPSKASSIVEYREQFGKFKTLEDLLKVSGIGPSSLEKMKDDIKL